MADDTPIDPKGGRFSSRALAIELLSIAGDDEIVTLAQSERYVEVMRMCNRRLAAPELSAESRALWQAALCATADATMDALTELR